MKKKLMVGVSALALTIGITGCGSNSGNSFKCTASEDSIQNEMIVYYDGNTVTKMEQKMIMDSASEAKEAYNQMKELYDAYGDSDYLSGKPTEMKVEGKNFIAIMSGKELTAEYDSLNVDDIKQELKDEGYTCK